MANGDTLQRSKMIYLFLYVRDLAASRTFYEQTLGLRVLEEDPGAVKYDAGGIILALNRGADFGIATGPAPDDTSVIVFYVDDIDAMRSALEKRGLEFSGDTVRYDIGATATFYDRDGHCFGLYEASKMAMMWPSAAKIRAIVGGKSTKPGAGPLTLAASAMVYLFLFVRDATEAVEFYGGRLQLPVIEKSPDGTVAKYDAGGVMLATHLVACEEGARARPEDLLKPRSIAPVFRVDDVDVTYTALSERRVPFSTRPSRSTIGSIARFADPSGHVFYIYETSAEALTWPSGRKIEAIAASSL